MATPKTQSGNIEVCHEAVSISCFSELVFIKCSYFRHDLLFMAGSLLRDTNGSSNPYILLKNLKWAAHVLLFSQLFCSRYFTISYIFVSGFAETP